MNYYRQGIGAHTQLLPTPVAKKLEGWHGLFDSYRAGLGQTLRGARYFSRIGQSTLPEASASTPVQRTASFVIGTIHMGLLVGGLATLARA